jgi:hypothetical protein
VASLFFILTMGAELNEGNQTNSEAHGNQWVLVGMNSKTCFAGKWQTETVEPCSLVTCK